MDCVWCFLKVWSWRSSSGCGFWGFDWLKNLGLLLVFGFGIMGLQYGLQLRCLISFAYGLIGKGYDLVCGVCSKFNFVDLWDEKFWSCGKCVWGLCKISILQLHVLHDCNVDSSKSSSCDFDVLDGNHVQSRLLCDECCYACSSRDEDELFWDCDDGAGGMGDDDDGVFDEAALMSEMVKFERQRADAAVMELVKERLAVATAVEEAMTMILRLQNEKSLIEIEARNYKKVAEQKMLYDKETILFLRSLLQKSESEQRLMKERLNLCRQKLKLDSEETVVDQFERLSHNIFDFILEDPCPSDNDAHLQPEAEANSL